MIGLMPLVSLMLLSFIVGVLESQQLELPLEHGLSGIVARPR
jgi:hypothetical protein